VLNDKTRGYQSESCVDIGYAKMMKRWCCDRTTHPASDLSRAWPTHLRTALMRIAIAHDFVDYRSYRHTTTKTGRGVFHHLGKPHRKLNWGTLDAMRD